MTLCVTVHAAAKQAEAAQEAAAAVGLQSSAEVTDGAVAALPCEPAALEPAEAASTPAAEAATQPASVAAAAAQASTAEANVSAKRLKKRRQKAAKGQTHDLT